ncbi:MAG: cache domain-containing protein [Balneolaceae bacterium]|nr:cache domain-containing protein [Balneolaceae bacterium]
MNLQKIIKRKVSSQGIFKTDVVYKAANLFVILLFFVSSACSDSEPRSDGTETDQYLQEIPQSEVGSRGTIEEARAMLERAVAHYNEVGREQALNDFTAKAEPFIDRDLYVFCYGPDRTISGHGADPGLLGTPVDELRDVDDFAFGTRIMDVGEESPEGGFVEYKWINPVTGEVEPKISIVRVAGTDICGVGAYNESS